MSLAVRIRRKSSFSPNAPNPSPAATNLAVAIAASLALRPKGSLRLPLKDSSLLVEAFAWAVMCALASAVLGFMGLLVGFVAAGIGRLAARDWGSKERAAEASRWRGPTITLTGRQTPDPRHLNAHEEAIYQIHYSCRTPERTSQRRVTVNVHITDGAGRKTYTYADWNVR
jgi:hypothetical protein